MTANISFKKMRSEIIKDVENSIETFFELSEDINNPRWIEWDLNSECWVICVGKCKCGNQNLKTESNFKDCLDYFSDEEIKFLYQQSIY